METHLILETNAYRQIAETKDLSEIQATANGLREKEKKVQAKSLEYNCLNGIIKTF